jgi:GAF domain-containing protein
MTLQSLQRVVCCVGECVLVQMRERLSRCDTFERAICTMLDDAIALLGAEYGNIQLLVGQDLVIAAQRGLSPDFLKTFRCVTKDDGSACGRALLHGKTVVIPDVEKDLEFAIYRNIARRTHFRAVQSTPMIKLDGTRLGIVSTHFANPHQPSKIELDTLQAYALTASQYAFELLSDTPLDAMAKQMSEVLYEDLSLSPGAVNA